MATRIVTARDKISLAAYGQERCSQALRLRSVRRKALKATSHRGTSASVGARSTGSQGRGANKAAAVETQETSEYIGPAAEPSPLQWKALNVTDTPGERLPSRQEILQELPRRLFEPHTPTSLAYTALSLGLTALCAYAGTFIPLNAKWMPIWGLYSAVTGTVATGLWVLAHECGHGAFSKNRRLETAVGYVLHSALLVPYFSWQRSHAVHHAFTNHMSLGETHVPFAVGEKAGEDNIKMKNALGEKSYGFIQVIFHLLFGWPMYLLTGSTGGPERGTTNHFWPIKPFSDALWPGRWKRKVWLSDIGVVATLAGLSVWVIMAGSPWPVFAMYGGPLLVVNCWLVGYTWLQHTETDVPHLGKDRWSWTRGAFLTIDRPYGPIFDLLHHRIGSTHVAHHVDPTIPHYKAKEATDIIKDRFPSLYLYDPTPVHRALWRVATKCVAVERRGNRFVFLEDGSQRLDGASQ